jgi:hypothetical protein
MKLNIKDQILDITRAEKAIDEIVDSEKSAQETFLRTVLQNESKSWSEFYRYVNRRKGNRENIPTIKD